MLCTDEEWEKHRERLNPIQTSALKLYPLKGCPFCGGKAKYSIYYSMHMDKDQISAECTKCYSQSRSIYSKEEDGAFATTATAKTFASCMTYVQQHWNARYESKKRTKASTKKAVSW